MKKILCVLSALLMFSSAYSSNISWPTTPTHLSSLNVNASNPEIAIDGNGNVVAAWIENHIVKSSYKPVNGSWSSEVSLSGRGASSLGLVSDLQGNATAVWVENGVIKTSTKSFNAQWTTSYILSNTGASSPSICVDASGHVVVVWVRGGNLESSTKLFGINWQTRTTIASTGAASPIVAIGGTGSDARAVVVWQGTCGNSLVVYTSTKLVLGSWTSEQIISEVAHDAAQPFTAVDSNGNALAIWYSYDTVGTSFTNVTVTSASRSSADNSWSVPTHLSAPGLRDPSMLVAQLAFDTTGNAIALWNISFDDQTFNLESAVKPVNGNWSAPVDLVESNLYAYSADLTTTTFGDVLGLYLFYNGHYLLIQSVETDINGYLNNFWSVPVTISNGGENAFPKIAAALSGNVIYAAAVWVNSNGVNNAIVAATGSKTLVLPPTQLNVTQNQQNFGVFNEYYNTLTWQASVDPNVVGYVIFRNGLFIGQVNAQTLEFIDNNRVQNGEVTYAVTAVDSLQSQSSTVSVSFP